MDPGPVLDDVSEAIADIYGDHYAVDRTSVTTYLMDDLLVCVLEDVVPTDAEQRAHVDAVLDQRRSFQRRHEPEFCAAVERITGRRVKTFLSANHVGDRIAAEVFFLAAAPAAT
jgi:uncharacterized protein YbcI